MKIFRTYGKQLAQLGAVGVLAAGAVGIASPAFAGSGSGPSTNGCFGKWYNTVWAQHCDSGARATGYYRTTADCTAPQIEDKHLEYYRYAGSRKVVNGPDCRHGVQATVTYFRAG